ncbi:MAG: aldo/keto reductase [Proteobacteria bacterium]|nr:aldo/keto reductase [Pseudomonadota bacterium]
MDKRRLGDSDLAFRPIALGGLVFGWTADEATSHRLLDAFVDAGGSLVETAESYTFWAPQSAWGRSEEVIGHWLRRHPGKRAKVLLATKCTELSRTRLRASVEASLARLGTDCIDLFQSHRDDTSVPLEETLSAYGELVREGKVRWIGASNHDAARLAEADRIARANGLPRYQSLQPHYNLLERPLFEGALEDECRRLGLGVLPYYPLAAGFLTGKYRSESDTGKSPRGASQTVRQYMTARGFAVLDALDLVARRHGASCATVALAWLLHRPSVTAPIASATSLAQLDELLAATRLGLDAESLAVLDAASATPPSG